MLLKKEEWKSLIEKAKISDKMKEEKDYILCYFVGNTVNYWKAVEKIKKQFDKNIVIIPYNADSYAQKGFVNIETGPNEFLWLIKNCSFLCTDSFHATVFSVIFHKQFIVFKTKRSSSRMKDLLLSLGIKGRIYGENLNINNTIDYTKIDEILSNLRKTSLMYIEKALKRE